MRAAQQFFEEQLATGNRFLLWNAAGHGPEIEFLAACRTPTDLPRWRTFREYEEALLAIGLRAASALTEQSRNFEWPVVLDKDGAKLAVPLAGGKAR